MNKSAKLKTIKFNAFQSPLSNVSNILNRLQSI